MRFTNLIGILLTSLLFQVGALPILLAQKTIDSLKTSPEVIVYGNRMDEFEAGTINVSSDSTLHVLYSSASLSHYLERTSTIFLKTYGLGSLSTLSMRGASASQTSVLWNGFVLQSPMNGLLDLALVPMVLTDRIRIQFGGCGGLWGSGAVSGSIHLENTPRYGKGWSTSYTTSFGSFNTLGQSGMITRSTKKWILSVKGFYNEAQNDFRFKNTTTFGEPSVTQTNAALRQYGILVDQYLKLTPKQQLNIRFWYQDSYREIPPMMTQTSSDATQKDWFTRISSEWQRKGRRVTWAVRNAYFDEKLRFSQYNQQLNAFSNSISQITEAESKISILSNSLLTIGVTNTFSLAMVDNYIGIPRQNRSALFAAYKYASKNNTIHLTFGARKEYITGNTPEVPSELPIMPFVGSDLTLFPKLILKAKISRNYRLPTFNDLYWAPGGNPLLKPEQGWSEEVGLHYQSIDATCNGDSCTVSKKFFSKLKFSSTFFNRVIDNWILWVPEQNFWGAQNILKVWSRGLENSVDATLSISSAFVHLGLRYDYVVSTTQKVPEGKNQELGKQLIYVPLHKGGATLGLEVKKIVVHYTHLFTGWVYTQADNSANIDAYWLGNISVSKTFQVEKNNISIQLSLNNLTDKVYQVIAYRPMPGRNYQCSLTYSFN